MALTPEQEWTLVACGMIAHADDILEVGEWDEIVRLVNARLDDAESDHWLAVLMDRAVLENHFAELAPPAPIFAEELLRQAWRMALADGDGSDIEAAVHDRIADKIGIDGDAAQALRDDWNARAADCAEVVVAFAAALANLDGRMDPDEAVQFDALLERQPVTVSRRLQLAELLYNPPEISALGERVATLRPEDQKAVLYDIAPFVNASHRGDRERAVFFDLATKAAISREAAQALLDA